MRLRSIEFLKKVSYSLIYLTLHWPFLINLRQYSLSINIGRAGFFNVLFTRLMCGKVVQWLRFGAVNHDTMGLNPAETVYIFFLDMSAHSFLGYPGVIPLATWGCAHSTKVENCFLSKCDAIVATIFSLKSQWNIRLSFRHGDMLLDFDNVPIAKYIKVSNQVL